MGTSVFFGSIRRGSKRWSTGGWDLRKPDQKCFVLKSHTLRISYLGYYPTLPQKSYPSWDFFFSLFSALLSFNWEYCKVFKAYNLMTWKHIHYERIPPIELMNTFITSYIYLTLKFLWEHSSSHLVNFIHTIQCFWNSSWILMGCVFKSEGRLRGQTDLGSREVNKNTHQIGLSWASDKIFQIECFVQFLVHRKQWTVLPGGGSKEMWGQRERDSPTSIDHG